MNKLGKIVIAASIIASAAISAVVIAQPQFAFVRTYYSGPDMNQKVGWYSQSCTNAARGGQSTDFYIDELLGQCYPDLDENGDRTPD